MEISCHSTFIGPKCISSTAHYYDSFGSHMSRIIRSGKRDNLQLSPILILVLHIFGLLQIKN
ncbi:hypothetical protein ACJIZ3_008809 [Penstemon smallii]|uniref:Uncharacterized protein n=1 Tax=Penstemon smallii TaxID=265156 RepID=A0ABD3TCH4_9LAMI